MARTMSASYRTPFREALHEMELALKAKDGLEHRVAELKDALPALAQLGEPTKQEAKLMQELMAAAGNGALNLTRAVRLELAMANRPLTTIEMRDLLVRRRFSFASYSNPMAAIHSALNRMVAGGEVVVEQESGHRPAYRTARKRVQPVRCSAHKSEAPEAD